MSSTSENLCVKGIFYKEICRPVAISRKLATTSATKHAPDY